jgi:peptidoglycan/xylan/chitin deacetylase (PgdA/CDA1 family)
VDKLSSLQSRLFSTCSALLSPAGERGSLVVLMYHRVLPEPDALLLDEPDARTFAAHMDVVRSTFNVIGLTEAIERMRTRSLPSRAACITFDDGYANNFEVALPILAQRKLPATVFVTTQFIGGGRMFNDTIVEVVRHAGAELDLTRFDLGRYALTDAAARRAAIDAILEKLKYFDHGRRLATANEIAGTSGLALPQDLMMSETMIRGLHTGGVEIGAHTESHPILANISDEDARREIHESKARLEAVIGAPVATFAYPNGRPRRDYERRHVELVKSCGFRGAVSTARGCARRDSDLFQIPRMAPWDRTAVRFAGRLLKTYFDPPAEYV